MRLLVELTVTFLRVQAAAGVDAVQLFDAHVLNLGHGVLPETDPDVLTRVTELAHSG
jgi:uroporphyrinogen decarboxylase